MRHLVLTVLRLLATAAQVMLAALASPHQRLPPTRAEERLRRRRSDYRP